MMIIGIDKRILSAREAKAMSQERLAKSIGTTKQTISGYETGHSSPPARTLKALANSLGVSIDYLLDNQKYIAVCVDGLNDEQIKIVSAVVEGFRKANNNYG